MLKKGFMILNFPPHDPALALSTKQAETTERKKYVAKFITF
jgi:hypothetical protein